MENNMQTNPEQNNQKSYVTSDTSFTPDKNTHETQMTDHSLNENEDSREQKQTQSDNISSQSNRTSDTNEGYQASGGSNRDSGYEIEEEDIEVDSFSPCSRKM